MYFVLFTRHLHGFVILENQAYNFSRPFHFLLRIVQSVLVSQRTQTKRFTNRAQKKTQRRRQNVLGMATSTRKSLIGDTNDSTSSLVHLLKFE